VNENLGGPGTDGGATFDHVTAANLGLGIEQCAADESVAVLELVSHPTAE
jgi:hypothetical protein